MLSTGFKLSVKDTQKLREFKRSSAYGTYLKAIKSSPIFVTIINEHIKNVDITNDIKKLQHEGSISEDISADAIAQLFKASIRRMAINIAADTIILKELEDKIVDDVINEIRQDSDLVYLLGMADDKFYREAERLITDGKIAEDDIAFLGLINWMKRQDNLPKKSNNIPHDDITPKSSRSYSEATSTTPKAKVKSKRKTIDPDALDIEL